jgi:hypothetical protein
MAKKTVTVPNAPLTRQTVNGKTSVEKPTPLTRQKVGGKVFVEPAPLAIELRSIFRSLPADKRTLRGVSPAMREAVIHADPIASGVSPSEHAMARDELTKAMFPNEVNAIAEEAEGLKFLDEAIRLAEDEMKIGSGLKTPQKAIHVALPEKII